MKDGIGRQNTVLGHILHNLTLQKIHAYLLYSINDILGIIL